jgi:hypothetical protein
VVAVLAQLGLKVGKLIHYVLLSWSWVAGDAVGCLQAPVAETGEKRSQ